MADGDGLENRCPSLKDRGFESHPHPHYIARNPKPFLIGVRGIDYIREASPLLNSLSRLARLNRHVIQHSKTKRVQLIPLNVGFDQNIVFTEP